MHINIRKSLFLFIVVASLGAVGVGLAAYNAGYFATQPIFSTDAGAIGGYDPVAYFTMGEAIQGSDQITVEHKGAVWRFQSEEHKQAFLGDPEQYLPQYGGYCAYAMSENYTAYSDPTAWKVASGRLFLNYSHEVQAEWEKDQASRVSNADRNWIERQAE